MLQKRHKVPRAETCLNHCKINGIKYGIKLVIRSNNECAKYDWETIR